MAKRRIYMTVQDMSRLGHVLIDAVAAADDPEPLQALEREIDEAEAVRREDIPQDVVTMNSHVRYTNLDTGETHEITLVFPGQEEGAPGRLSVLSPVGTALLGYKAGDKIHWKWRDTTLKLRVDAVLYQPEASKDFHL